MSVRQYFEFKGVKYGVGTIAKVPRMLDTRWLSRDKIMEEAEFVGGACFVFKNLNGSINLYESSGHFSGKYEKYIEIIKPIYYHDSKPLESQNIFFRTSSGSWEAHNEVCVGLTWYIAIMLLAVIFKDRLIIWIITTIVFFLWKSKK